MCVLACNCHENGSLSGICHLETGLCDCKPYVTGQQCDQCLVRCLLGIVCSSITCQHLELTLSLGPQALEFTWEELTPRLGFPIERTCTRCAQDMHMVCPGTGTRCDPTTHECDLENIWLCAQASNPMVLFLFSDTAWLLWVGHGTWLCAL